MQAKTRSSKAFTLIELAIVLVVIGLVAGGFLVGKDMIEAAKIRAELQQIDKFRAAENTFRVKYNALPGDMPAATGVQFGLVVPLTSNANGDGLLNGSTGHCLPGRAKCFGWPAVESTSYFLQLSSISCGNAKGSGLIPSPSTNGNPMNGACQIDIAVNSYTTPGVHTPLSKINSRFGILPVTANRFDMGVWYILNGSRADYWLGNHTISPSITPSQASSIDFKVDDGIPSKGSVRAYRVFSGTVNGLGWDDEVGNDNLPANGCIIDAAGSAYATGNNVSCKIIIKK